jgi:hypothetical protein
LQQLGAAANDYVVTATVGTDFGAGGGAKQENSQTISLHRLHVLFMFFHFFKFNQSRAVGNNFRWLCGSSSPPERGPKVVDLGLLCSRHPAESVGFGNNGPATQ